MISIAAHVALFVLPKIKPPELVMAGNAQEQPMTVRLIDVQPSLPSAPESTPTPPVQPQPGPPPPPPRPPPIPELDMAAMIEARRTQRRANQESQGSGQRPNLPPSPDQLASANIARNLRMDEGRGVGGVFEILRKSTRTAEFAFNGWRPDTEKRWAWAAMSTSRS